MKMINSIAALALYALTVSLVATASEATAGEYDFYMNAHRALSNGSPNTLVAALDEHHAARTRTSEVPFANSNIERAQAAFAAQLALDCAPGMQMHWVAEEAVYQYALSRVDVRLQVEGRASVAEHLCALSAVAPDAIVQNIHYFPTLKPDLVYVQYDLIPTDGTRERSRPLAIIEMQGDQIVRFTQLSRSPESMTVVNAAM
jgi:hypothetical protein